jgi:Rrf2 family cysteine metabolism transcriptional repressor
MLELAASYTDPQPVRIKAIAEAQGIPPRFLVQILLHLKTAGLVASVRGAAGGYQLARPPESISLAAVINAIDDPNFTPHSALDEAGRKRRKERVAAAAARQRGDRRISPARSGHADTLPSRAVEALLGVWRQIHAEEQRFLDNLTLAELLRRAEQSNALSYQI